MGFEVVARDKGDGERERGWWWWVPGGGSHLFGQQGDEVSLKLWFDHLHHVLDLRGLTAVNQLIQRQQLLWATPALEHIAATARHQGTTRGT